MTNETHAEIEAEQLRRQQNRPPNSEVDNTRREFSAELKRFVDCDWPGHKM